jgi:serine/threonine protein kinase
VKRLRDEGRMLAILDHPCIVRVIEMTLIRGRVALVTEYLDGVDLARCCRPPRLLPPKVIVGALGEVASALHCAWTTLSPETGKPLELIHRDVKPENIRIGRHGEVKLLDFGIARTTEMFRHARTAIGDLPFTPGYAAPEAFTKGFQGSASDVYALGVTMFRLLAGERLYEEMELADQVTICCLPERYAPFLRQRLTKVSAPEPVVGLLRDMLAYEPLDRPTAAEVEARCTSIADALDGPTHVRWARATDFPEPIGLPDGTLTGQTITEDRMQENRSAKRRGVRLRPKSTSSRSLLNHPDPHDGPPRPLPAPNAPHPGLVVDLTPPSREPPRAPPPPTPVPGGSRAYTPERAHPMPARPPDASLPRSPDASLPAPAPAGPALAAPSAPRTAPPPPPTDLVGVRPVTGRIRSASAAARDASVAPPEPRVAWLAEPVPAPLPPEAEPLPADFDSKTTLDQLVVDPSRFTPEPAPVAAPPLRALPPEMAVAEPPPEPRGTGEVAIASLPPAPPGMRTAALRPAAPAARRTSLPPANARGGGAAVGLAVLALLVFGVMVLGAAVITAVAASLLL